VEGSGCGHRQLSEPAVLRTSWGGGLGSSLCHRQGQPSDSEWQFMPGDGDGKIWQDVVTSDPRGEKGRPAPQLGSPGNVSERRTLFTGPGGWCQAWHTVRPCVLAPGREGQCHSCARRVGHEEVVGGMRGPALSTLDISTALCCGAAVTQTWQGREDGTSARATCVTDHRDPHRCGLQVGGVAFADNQPTDHPTSPVKDRLCDPQSYKKDKTRRPVS
jgi:hypothetical protein